MGNRHVRFLVELDVPDQVIRIRLPPVAARAAGPGHAAEAPAVGVVAVRLHVPGRTPRVGVYILHPVRVLGLLRYPELLVVRPVPLVDERLGRASWTFGRDGYHVVGAHVRRGTYAVSQDGEACAFGCREEEVEGFALLGLGELAHLYCPLEGFGHAEAVHCLVGLCEVHRYCGSGLSPFERQRVVQSRGMAKRYCSQQE